MQDRRENRKPSSFQGHNNIIRCIAVLPNGNVISASDTDNNLNVWDADLNKSVMTLQGHLEGVKCIAVLPSGNVISCSNDNTLKMWNVKTGKCFKTLPFEDISCLTVLPHGNVIIGQNNQLKEVCNDEYRIRSVARILAQGYRYPECLFFSELFPKELHRKIIRLVVDSTDEDYEIIDQYFCKP